LAGGLPEPPLPLDPLLSPPLPAALPELELVVAPPPKPAPVLELVLVLVLAPPPVPELVLELVLVPPELELVPAPPVPLPPPLPVMPASPFGAQTPAVHTPVEHGVPSGFAGFEHIPLIASHVPASWHSSIAVHTTGVPVQAPAVHVSPCVQALPSLQVVPLASGGYEHTPLTGLQAPAAWQGPGGAHPTVTPPWQTPARQVSPVVHRLPSLHMVPSGAVGFEHVPFAGLHTPVV